VEFYLKFGKPLVIKEDPRRGDQRTSWPQGRFNNHEPLRQALPARGAA